MSDTNKETLQPSTTGWITSNDGLQHIYNLPDAFSIVVTPAKIYIVDKSSTDNLNPYQKERLQNEMQIAFIRQNGMNHRDTSPPPSNQ
jgi:hypothetical protein